MKKATARNYVEDLLLCLNRGLAGWAEEVLERRFSEDWRSNLETAGSPARHAPHSTKSSLSDPQVTLRLIIDHWNDVFKHEDNSTSQLRTLLFEIKDTRNAWAHHDPISTRDAYRTADSVVRTLELIKADEKAEAEQTRRILHTKLNEDSSETSFRQSSGRELHRPESKSTV